MKTIRARIRIIRNVTVLIGLGIILGAALFSTSSVSYATREVPVDGTPAKLDALKADVVARLESCESAGHDADSGLIVFDSNHIASLGVLQWQVKSVQYYEKLLHQQEVTGTQAVAIAMDAAQARALATEVIFDTSDGLHNWINCGNKLQLAPEVAVIKKLGR
jgi:hypothetical protein